MPRLISDLVPNADYLTQLTREEVGGLILQHMKSPDSFGGGMMHKGNYLVPAMLEGYNRRAEG